LYQRGGDGRQPAGDALRRTGGADVEDLTPAKLERPTAHLLLPCRSDSVPTLRALLHRDLERWAVAEEVADAILLAAGEAVTNAVVHGSWGQQDSVMVIRWAVTAGRFSFSVQDRGPGFESSRTAMSRRAHPSQNRGRGLYIMHALMDRVVVDSGLNGTRILLEKAMEAPAP
jgi:anti-sigma regulatory factor (Ser/Thr protein kinase)